MLRLVCVFFFSAEQNQFFSWRGIGRIKGICKRVSKGGGGRGPDPPGTSQKYSNTGPDPPKNHKVRSQHSMLGHHRHASETPFKWRFAGVPMMARLKWHLDPLTSQQKKKKKRNWRFAGGPMMVRL